MSGKKINWLNVGIGIFIIFAIVLLLVLVLPFSNLAVEQDQIAVISISGAVTYDSSNSTRIYTSASKIESKLNDAISDKNVKAIVLDINSKGGSEVACTEIAEEIKNSPKPDIAYIGDKGWDEAYLISSSCDSIVANSASSIGGIGLTYIDCGKYSNEKLTGVYNENYLNMKKSNQSKVDNLSNGQMMIDQDYTQFVKKIAEYRDMDPNYLSQLAYGKKYNGNEAKNYGLIDEIGNKNNAIKLAASTSNATNYTVVNYPPAKKSLTETLSENKIFHMNNSDFLSKYF